MSRQFSAVIGEICRKICKPGGLCVVLILINETSSRHLKIETRHFSVSKNMGQFGAGGLSLPVKRRENPDRE
jgi:hypothetical protein